jgi:choline-glycine betaine transporter
VNIFQVEGTFYWLLELGMLAVKIAAFVISLMYSEEAYRAADKLNKAAWAAILGIGVAVQLILAGSPIGILNLAFTIAALVFFADVRPALAGLRRR